MMKNRYNRKGLFRDKLTITPIGGLGNQLFIYFAGRFMADKLRKNLEIDISLVSVVGSTHVGDIGSLQLPGKFVDKVYKRNILCRLIDRLDKKIMRHFEVYHWMRLHIFGYFQSRELGFEQTLEGLKRVSSINGYFQTWRYFEYYATNKKEYFRLDDPSSWFKEMCKSAEAIKPIAIHIRRGDYTLLQEDFGLLSLEYYAQSIQYARGLHSTSEIWVFSDDIALAEQLLTPLNNPSIKYISSPTYSTPIESLLLISECKVIITANSTFSYWAGLIQSPAGYVIAPEKWFKNRKDPVDLIPPTWIKIPSSWVGLN
jgi:hypothetical protein